MADPNRYRDRAAMRWGRSPEHAGAHAAAARLQAQYPNLVIWFGETSGHFFAVAATGLHERPTVDALALFAWQRTNRPRPRGVVAVVR
ncbi:hypothetical protein [Nocardiopsis suaedae]|uniref:Uncharacterized protein n=1 Tax=Nocardiopsis suaedae TaxID=3018444 RepID=A0ABT4TM94_9ACTN|nr:hypothetical protein [Nocardiopsis suaedae]MDA2805808.1 hypothetical protein [Nocardiopsis suaedae]